MVSKMTDEEYLKIGEKLKQRYKMKKSVNILISAVIVLLGTVSVAFIFRFDKEGILTFRWLTVDGTLFTIVCSSAFIAINLIEIFYKTELTAVSVYYIRLSGAVAEGLIMIVVLLSQLPIFEDHMHILRFDMFNMHLLIPLLTISSFIINDAAIGKLKLKDLLKGTRFVTVYAVIIIILIQSGVLKSKEIPYFFLDFANMEWWLILMGFAIIYGIGILLSYCISEMNRKLSWLWLKNIAR